MEGCGKDTIIIIILMVLVLGALAYFIIQKWKSIAGMIEPMFEWF